MWNNLIFCFWKQAWTVSPKIQIRICLKHFVQIGKVESNNFFRILYLSMLSSKNTGKNISKMRKIYQNGHYLTWFDSIHNYLTLKNIIFVCKMNRLAWFDIIWVRKTKTNVEFFQIIYQSNMSTKLSKYLIFSIFPVSGFQVSMLLACTPPTTTTYFVPFSSVENWSW